MLVGGRPGRVGEHRCRSRLDAPRLHRGARPPIRRSRPTAGCWRTSSRLARRPRRFVLGPRAGRGARAADERRGAGRVSGFLLTVNASRSQARSRRPPENPHRAVSRRRRLCDDSARRVSGLVPRRHRLGLRPSRDKGEELDRQRTDGTNARVILRGDSVAPLPPNPAWSPDGRQIASFAVPAASGVTSGSCPPMAAPRPRRLRAGVGALGLPGLHSRRPGHRSLVEPRRCDQHLVRAARRAAPGPPDDRRRARRTPTIAADGSIAFVNSRWRNSLEAHGLAAAPRERSPCTRPFSGDPPSPPDGREVAFSQGEADGSWHIWSVPFDGGQARQLASTEAGEVYPRWSPDGSYVLFNTWTEPRRLGRVSAHGGALSAPTLLSFNGEGTAAFADIAPDGRRIAFSRAESSGERVYVGPADGGASAG